MNHRIFVCSTGMTVAGSHFPRTKTGCIVAA